MPKRLQDYSVQELQQALESKQKAQESKPAPVDNPDFSTLVTVVIGGVEKMIEDQYQDDDFKQWVYEAAMKAVYGTSYFEWRNKQDW